MTEKHKNTALVCLMSALLLILSLWSWFRTPDRSSDSERRLLAQFPEINSESLLSADFMENFELYTQDQFPMRDGFRTLKALSSRYMLGQLDNNGLYLADGHVSKLQYPLDERMLEHAAGRFKNVYDKFLAGSGSKLYFSIVPDKNYFLAQKNGYPALDYDSLVAEMREKTDYMEYIDIFPLLSADDYYYTDTHWRQENILPVAEALLNAMGAESESPDYDMHTLENPFYGVYAGQSALPLKPDTIRYLSNDILDNCTVTSYNTGVPEKKSIYTLEKAESHDPYEIFLSGADALITIENPAADSGRELIIFRDSYGSSLTPLLVHSYAKITLVDLRYINSALLDRFIDFNGQDVLFIYSTMLLNNSLALK